MSAAARILVARETAQITYGKKGLERVIVHKGVTRVREGHPMLKGHADLFEPLRPHFEVDGCEDNEPVIDDPAGCPDCAARAEADAAAEPTADAPDGPPADATDAPADAPADAAPADEPPAAEPVADAPVETLTANPGEKRVTKPRAPRTPRKRG